ncbi:MAG: amino acid ABC transporter permease, partial [Anaerolineales bacterium]
AEIFRAGIQSIERGQMEAARSLGMTYIQSMRYVILPQAIRRVLPPLGNDFIAMLKDSSLATVLAVPELTQLGRVQRSSTFRVFEVFNSVAFLYLTMTLILSFLVRTLERRLSSDTRDEAIR